MKNASPDYPAARREWLERYGDYIAQAKNWRLMAFGSLAIAAMFGAGLVYEAQRVKVEPYVVAVDKLGESVRLAQAVQAGAAQQPVVTHVISSWLLGVRERISDTNAEKALVADSYNYTMQSSTQALNAYFSANSPYEADTAGSILGSRTVEIQSALPLGNPTSKGGTYQVTWVEKDFGKDGTLAMEQKWVGNIQYTLLPPDQAGSTQQMLSNPFGVYITSFQWQKSL